MNLETSVKFGESPIYKAAITAKKFFGDTPQKMPKSPMLRHPSASRGLCLDV